MTTILANLTQAKRAGFEQTTAKRLLYGHEGEGRAAVGQPWGFTKQAVGSAEKYGTFYIAFPSLLHCHVRIFDQA